MANAHKCWQLSVILFKKKRNKTFFFNFFGYVKAPRKRKKLFFSLRLSFSFSLTCNLWFVKNFICSALKIDNNKNIRNNQ